MNRRHIGAVVLLVGMATAAISASGQSGIYAVIEKVTDGDLLCWVSLRAETSG